MKKFVFFVVLGMMLFVGACGQSKTEEMKSIIPGKRTGPFVHGKAVPQSLDGYELLKKTTADPDGDPIAYYEVQQSGKKVLEVYFELTDGVEKIFRSGVFSDEYLTPEGLGVGSTLEDLQKVYPTGTVSYIPAGASFIPGEELFIFEPETSSLLFILDKSGYKKQPGEEHSNLSFNDFKSGTKVEKLFH